MTVFKGYLLIIKRNLHTILMYIFIFMGITLAIQKSFTDSSAGDGFSSAKLKVAVMDRDGGSLADTLKRMLERKHHLVEIQDDAQIIQEELYYRNVDYILVVPEGAEELLRQGEMAVQSISVPNTLNCYYARSQINVFLNQIGIYLNCGYSMEEACAKALKLSETGAEVTLLDVNGNAGERELYNYYFGYMPYAFLGATIMAVSLVLLEFKRTDIRQRMESCAVPFWKQSLAMAGAFLAIGAAIWLICIVVQTILYQGGIFRSEHRIFYLLNSLDCLLVSLALGFLAGMISGGPSSLSGINNVFSLGLCFLGGIMVPLEMLGEGVQKVSRFLPTYWYSVINGILGDYKTLGEELSGTIWKGLLIQLLFALAAFSVAMVIRRWRLQEA